MAQKAATNGEGQGTLVSRSPGFLVEGGCVGGGRRRVTKADLEAMLGEFEIVEHYGGTSAAVELHLNQIRRNARFGVSLDEWASMQGVSLAYARALQRYLDQG